MNITTWFVPATSANLGPGFDALGLALTLYNKTTVSLTGHDLQIEIRGQGADYLPRDTRNLTLRAFEYLCQRAGQPLPRGLHIVEENAIPSGSGLGSSAAAVLSGLLAANDLLGTPFDENGILRLASEMEGHPDNAAAALWGGLTVSAGSTLVRRFDLPAWTVVVVTPRVYWPTRKARAVLPRRVTRHAAAENIGRAILVTEALRQRDLPLLRQTMQDALHQPYRLPHIPGARQALTAAQKLGAAAALSGAGPSLIAFAPEGRAEQVGAAMRTAFRRRGVKQVSVRVLPVSNRGAYRG